MALDQGAVAGGVAAAGTVLAGMAVPMSLADLGWLTFFCLFGVLAKHCMAASDARKAAKIANEPLPQMDVMALAYDLLSAPFLGSVGWAAARIFFMWRGWELPEYCLAPIAMGSGFFGSTMLQYFWSTFTYLMNKKVGRSS